MLPSLRTCLVLPLILLIASTTLTAQSGTLSSSFGTKGLLTDPSRQAFENAITTQPDKKILIGSQGFYQGYQTFLIDRLLPDGTKDDSFGTNGTAYILFQGAGNTGNINSEIHAIALLPDGKIIAAGQAAGNGKDIAIARLLPDGTPDTSFGRSGTSLTGFNTDETPTGLAVQPDGKLVICGNTLSASAPGGNHFFVARYLADGSIDSSFEKKGIVVSAYTGSANAVVVQPSGKIVAGGYSTGADGISFHIECYGANGSYDDSFGTRGVVDNRINGGFLNFINDIALQNDGKLLVAGRTNGSDVQAFTVVRYNNNGSLDNSFGVNGVVIASYPGTTGEARKILLTAKGDHILAAGTRNDNSGSDFIVASYTLTGAPDVNFGKGGIATADFGGNDIDNSATLCADGSVVALGSNTGQYPFPVRALAKYKGYAATVPLLVRIKRWLQNHTLTWNGLPADYNIASYKVEQSSNGKTGFAEIAAISGSSKLKEYSLTNSRLLAGTNYYRIKAVGADGSLTYSETVSLDNAVSALSVTPNPARDVIILKGLRADGTSYISIAGIGGRVMIKAVSKNNPQYRMTVSSLQKGIYYITITAPDGFTERGMFVKE